MFCYLYVAYMSKFTNVHLATGTQVSLALQEEMAVARAQIEAELSTPPEGGAPPLNRQRSRHSLKVWATCCWGWLRHGAQLSAYMKGAGIGKELGLWEGGHVRGCAHKGRAPLPSTCTPCACLLCGQVVVPAVLEKLAPKDRWGNLKALQQLVGEAP